MNQPIEQTIAGRHYHLSEQKRKLWQRALADGMDHDQCERLKLDWEDEAAAAAFTQQHAESVSRA